jgi:hypothetical protein
MKSNKRSAFDGLALAVIQSTSKEGNIRITAVSDGLREGVIHVISNKTLNRQAL